MNFKKIEISKHNQELNIQASQVISKMNVQLTSDQQIDYELIINEIIDYLFESKYKKDEKYIKCIYYGYEYNKTKLSEEFTLFELIDTKENPMHIINKKRNYYANEEFTPVLKLTPEKINELDQDLKYLWNKYKNTVVEDSMKLSMLYLSVFGLEKYAMAVTEVFPMSGLFRTIVKQPTFEQQQLEVLSKGENFC